MAYECVLPFDTDNVEFVRGFEAGAIWAHLRNGDLDELDGQAFHAENTEMVVRMLDATTGLGCRLRSEFTADPGWMVLRHA